MQRGRSKIGIISALYKDTMTKARIMTLCGRNFFCGILLLMALYSPLVQSQVTSSNTASRTAPPPDDSSLSLELKSRLFMPYSDTTGNGWLNELNVGYDLDSHWKLGLWGGYIQMFDPSKSTGSDWEDSELSVTYSFWHRARFPKPTLELTLGAVLPTSLKYDQQASETGGAFIRDRFVMDYSYVKFEQRLTVYQYFYKNRSYVDKLPEEKPAPNSDGSEDNYALTDAATLTTPTPSVVSNSVNYITAKFIGLLPIIVKPLILRNEIWFESWQNFDGSAANIIHDLPGLGYVWSSHVSTWISLDCNKSLSTDASIFDRDHITSLFTVYLSI